MIWSGLTPVKFDRAVDHVHGVDDDELDPWPPVGPDVPPADEFHVHCFEEDAPDPWALVGPDVPLAAVWSVGAVP